MTERRPLVQLSVTAGIFCFFFVVAAVGPALAVPPGMEEPGQEAVVFMPGVVSTPAAEFGLAVTRDWTALYFTRIQGDASFIYRMDRTDAGWSDPYVASFSRPGGASHPWLASDESRLYFVSRRPCPGSTQALNVWTTEGTEDGWATPQPLGKPVTNQAVHAPSVSSAGTIYATGLKRLRKTDTGYAAPEKLAPDIEGSHPAVAPDESFLVFSARRHGGHGANDLYVIFARADGSWGEPINLGPGVNTETVESSPSFSSDGEFLFFSRRGEIWWVSADVVRELAPKDAD
jgi:hypothetical protein